MIWLSSCTRSRECLNCEVVSEAARWFKAQMKGAHIPFNHSSCDAEAYYGYAAFHIQSTGNAKAARLEVKIFEIDEHAHAFCSVSGLHGKGTSDFPYFTEIASEQGRRALLAYSADFLLGAGHRQE